MAEPISVINTIKGEIDPPEPFQNLFKVLNTGSDSLTCSSQKSCLTDSSTADAVYARSGGGGELIPGKHFALGLILKSLTGIEPTTT